MLLTQEGGHLQGLQPCRADEAHQVDGIIAHTARDHQKGLGFVGPCFLKEGAKIFGSQIENGEGTFFARASRGFAHKEEQWPDEGTWQMKKSKRCGWITVPIGYDEGPLQ